jgi:uroporphyrin-III C-methyltransferase
VTERGLADRFLVTTAMGEGGRRPKVPAFAEDLTLLVLMGVGALDQLSAALQEAGWPADWPAAAISNASRPEQRVVRGTIASLPEAARTGEIAAPATLVFGRVAADAAVSALRHTA